MGRELRSQWLCNKPKAVNDSRFVDIISPILDQIKPDTLRTALFSGSDQSGASAANQGIN